jgi:hypothetical protein
MHVSTLDDSDEENDGEGPLAKKQKMNGESSNVATVTLEDDADQKIQQVDSILLFFVNDSNV